MDLKTRYLNALIWDGTSQLTPVKITPRMPESIVCHGVRVFNREHCHVLLGLYNDKFHKFFVKFGNRKSYSKYFWFYKTLFYFIFENNFKYNILMLLSKNNELT